MNSSFFAEKIDFPANKCYTHDIHIYLPREVQLSAAYRLFPTARSFNGYFI